MCVSFLAGAMLPQQAVRSAKRVSSYQRLPKKSSVVSPKRSIASQMPGAKRVGAETSQTQVEASSYWSRAYASLALTSGKIWNSFKGMFSKPQFNDGNITRSVDTKSITAPDLSLFPVAKSVVVQEGQPAKNLLPLVTKEQAIAQVAHDALNDIEKAHKEKHVSLAEKGLMVCTPPGINSALLLEFDSIEAIQNYFKKRLNDIDLNYKDIEGLSETEFDAYLGKRKYDHEYLSQVYYKQSSDETMHDLQIPSFILEETKRLLKLVGINPWSISIMGDEDKSTARAGGPRIAIQNGIYKVIEPAVIKYNLEQMAQLDHATIIFVIAHEIGHLLQCHHYSIEKYPQSGWMELIVDPSVEAKRSVKEAALKRLNRELLLLQELEADVTVALLNREVVDIIKHYLLRTLAKPHTSISDATNLSRHDKYQNTNDRYLWIQRINELHKKEQKRPDL